MAHRVKKICLDSYEHNHKNPHKKLPNLIGNIYKL